MIKKSNNICEYHFFSIPLHRFKEKKRMDGGIAQLVRASDS